MNEKKFKWECDICGTRFNNFQAEGFNRKIYCPLCFFKELNKQNEQQLQAHKTKEDKLRKIIENNLFIAYEEEQSTINICFWEELQQILNEGGKE